MGLEPLVIGNLYMLYREKDLFFMWIGVLSLIHWCVRQSSIAHLASSEFGVEYKFSYYELHWVA